MSTHRIRALLPKALWLIAILGSAIATTPPTQAADAQRWQVVSASGDVMVRRSGATTIALKSDDALAPGDHLETGPDSRLVLRRGADTIVVAPNSSVAIPEQRGGVTSLLQAMGTLLVKVERRATPNFEVRTPYLTAVVKGTSFSVSVDASGAGVHVLEGQVQVSDSANTQSALLAPGSTARMGAAPGRPMQLDGPARRIDAQPAVAAPAIERVAAMTPAAMRIANPIALAAVDIDRNTRGLVANDGERADQARGAAADGKGDAENNNKSSRGASVRGNGIGNGLGNGIGGGSGTNGNAFANGGLVGNGNAAGRNGGSALVAGATSSGGERGSGVVIGKSKKK